MQVDIVGGGLSGLATALSIKQCDPTVDVFVHEKHNQIGKNHDARKCGEAHCVESFSLKWKPPVSTIATEIIHGETIAGNKKYINHRAPGTAWILDRPAYISYLGDLAKDLDVEILTNDRINDVFSLAGDVIVDASGCPSGIKKTLGFPQRYLCYGFQQTLKDCSAYLEKTIKIIFEEHGGYYWLFPRHPEKREVNIGIGFSDLHNEKLPLLLEKFKQRHQITGTLDYSAGGLIPGGLQYPLRYKHILFVGDAGVGTFPLTGQGIYRALLSGDKAGRYIVNKDLKGYAHHMFRDFIKMDVVGKCFFQMNRLIGNINKDLVLDSWNWYLSLNDRISFFKSDYDTFQKQKKLLH